LSAITSASKRKIARSAAMSASCSSIRVAVPRPWKSSATAKATSAAPGSRRRSYAGGGDDPVAVAADQRDAVGPRRLGVLARRRIRAAEAVEAHVPALLGEGVVERLDRLEVVPARACAAGASIRRAESTSRISGARSPPHSSQWWPMCEAARAVT
jgi:hypothetical protein